MQEFQRIESGSLLLFFDWHIGIAKDLLRHAHKNIAQVALEVGYGSASAFSIAFSRQTGQPPGQFARQCGRDVGPPSSAE